MPIINLNQQGQADFTEEQQVVMEKVCKAMARVGAVPKRAENRHSNYKYATADDVYDSVRKILAEVGLVPRITQTSCEIKHTGEGKDRKTWLNLVFDLWFMGETVHDQKTIMLQFLGPQSFQAASTYSLKYWLRDRLLLSTGEGDLDNYQADTPPGESQAPELRRADESAEQPALPMPTDRTVWAKEMVSLLGSPKEAKMVAKILGELGKHPGTLKEDDLEAALTTLTDEEAQKVEHILAGE